MRPWLLALILILACNQTSSQDPGYVVISDYNPSIKNLIESIKSENTSIDIPPINYTAEFTAYETATPDETNHTTTTFHRCLESLKYEKSTNMCCYETPSDLDAHVIEECKERIKINDSISLCCFDAKTIPFKTLIHINKNGSRMRYVEHSREIISEIDTIKIPKIEPVQITRPTIKEETKQINQPVNTKEYEDITLPSPIIPIAAILLFLIIIWKLGGKNDDENQD